jgi:hypothetical protein
LFIALVSELSYFSLPARSQQILSVFSSPRHNSIHKKQQLFDLSQNEAINFEIESFTFGVAFSLICRSVCSAGEVVLFKKFMGALTFRIRLHKNKIVSMRNPVSICEVSFVQSHLPTNYAHPSPYRPHYG